MELTRQVYIEDVQVGTEIPALRKRCTPRQLVMWAAASRDFYEIHYDVEYARSIGLSGLVVHGALKHAFLGQLLHDWIAPLGSIVEIGCSYRGLDHAGDELTCRGAVVEMFEHDGATLARLEIGVENDEGVVTTPGTAVVALPSRSEEGSH